MLLAIDVGNTQTVMGVIKNDEIITSWRIYTPKIKTGDEIGLMLVKLMEIEEIDIRDIDSAIACCVVPGVEDQLIKACRRYFDVDVLLVTGELETGMEILYQRPVDVGADRIANAVAAKEVYGVPCVVVDMGTATTFDVISSKGEYLGGVIAPGMEVSAKALFRSAAKLFDVELKKPPSVIGNSTVRSIQSGIFWGVIGQVDYILRRIEDQLKEKPILITTGGLSRIIVENSSYKFIHDLDLTLKGLAILYEKNKGKKQ